MEMTEENRQRLTAYETRTGPVLMALALAFVLVYGLPIVWTTIPAGVLVAVDALNVIIWLVFVVDLALRAYLSGRPAMYVLRHPIDLLLVIVPMLRVLRVLRVFTAANYLVSRGGAFALGRTASSAVIATVFLMVVAALAVLDAERVGAESMIESFGDALWWAGATVTTVGYGDVFPVTTTGRVVAFALMLVGISLLGVITASVAAWFVEKTSRGEDRLVAELAKQREEIAELRQLILSLRGPSGHS